MKNQKKEDRKQDIQKELIRLYTSRTKYNFDCSLYRPNYHERFQDSYTTNPLKASRIEIGLGTEDDKKKIVYDRVNKLIEKLNKEFDKEVKDKREKGILELEKELKELL